MPTPAAPHRIPLAVTWRGGVHLAGTPIWCDARRARDVCFVSHAEAGSRARHGQLIATRETLALVTTADCARRPESALPVPYGRPFSLGDVRLELFRSGHAAGAASLSVQRDGRCAVYAGPVNPHGGGLGGEADVRRCDELVVDARYAHPRYAFPPWQQARDDVVAFCHAVLARGSTPVLLVTSAAKGLDVARQLTNLRPVRGHRAIHRAARRLRAAGGDPPQIKRWAGKLPRGEIVVWLADAPWRERAGVRALVSGQACDAARVDALAVDAAFAWSNCADYGELLRYIEATGAERVFAVGRHAEFLASMLDEVTPIGGARQLSLF